MQIFVYELFKSIFKKFVTLNLKIRYNAYLNYNKIKKMNTSKFIPALFFIGKIIDTLIFLSLFIGIGLAFLFQDVSYLWISAISLMYYVLKTINIPIVSPLIRRLNWPFIKFKIFRLVNSNPFQVMSTMIYLEQDSEIKNLYIQKGENAFIEQIKIFLQKEEERIKGAKEKIHKLEDVIKQSKVENKSLEERKKLTTSELDLILPGEINENGKHILGSLMVDLNDIKDELDKGKKDGLSDSELKELSKQKLMDVLKNFEQAVEENKQLNQDHNGK